MQMRVMMEPLQPHKYLQCCTGSAAAPLLAFPSKPFSQLAGKYLGLLRSWGFTARSMLEVNTNYMSFTPRALTCLGLPFWHKGFREHPALQWILSVRGPALQHIPLCGVLFPREKLAFGALKK